MKITIDGRTFDTQKARAHWDVSYWDGSNHHTADLYLSSKGVLYGDGLSQWSNGHGAYEVLTPSEALERYQCGLSEAEIEKIIALCKIETE